MDYLTVNTKNTKLHKNKEKWVLILLLAIHIRTDINLILESNMTENLMLKVIKILQKVN